MQGMSNPPELKGVIPNAINHIFETITASSGVEYLVRCSYLEIYNEDIRDLLIDPKLTQKCDIKEDPQKGVFVKGLSDIVVESENDMNAILEKGFSNRTVAATQMNAESSRSHSIFTIIIEMSTKDEVGKDHIKVGKLNLVDLAGKA
jgi:kinesin family protein 3/17